MADANDRKGGGIGGAKRSGLGYEEEKQQFTERLICAILSY